MNLVQLEIGPLDPSTQRKYLVTKDGVNRMIRCRDIAMCQIIRHDIGKHILLVSQGNETKKAKKMCDKCKWAFQYILARSKTLKAKMKTY